jgi:taurine dioxygenase
MVLDTDADNPAGQRQLAHRRHLHHDAAARCGALCPRTPPAGGDTLWLSTIAAYETLSEPFKEFLGGVTAVHDFEKSFPRDRFASPAAARKWEEAGRRIRRSSIRSSARTRLPDARRSSSTRAALLASTS